MRVLVLSTILVVVKCGPATESYKGQYCTDPRTSHQHAAYTEWADAYSCTRHRCQPGGRSLAIYTVGCKRVEAPESAIECEEVVEDTNMQFPFCCTRLRCLVVVRGEVWTRVLGQPWETLPAAPWSHMYKMKKPPPGEGSFASKLPEQGPVYELTESDAEGTREKMLRSSKVTTEDPDYNHAPVQRAVPSLPQPDIVIALSTKPDSKLKPLEVMGEPRNKRLHKEMLRANNNYFEEEKESRNHLDLDGVDVDNLVATTDKHMQAASDERYYGFSKTEKPRQLPWTEIPQNQWNEHDPGLETDSTKDNSNNQQDIEHKSSAEKPSNLQALVDAIGSRMRDIETVVQRMSDKVQPPGDAQDKGDVTEDETPHKRNKASSSDGKERRKPKKPSDDQEHYKRFSVRNRGSKYLHTSESTTDIPLFVEDNNLNGYFSDASNSVLRRSGSPKQKVLKEAEHHPMEPVQTYMAPVETRRKSSHAAGDASEEKKHKKRQHKKKGKHHKKRHNKKRFDHAASAEVAKNVVSLEDSSAVGA